MTNVLSFDVSKKREHKVTVVTPCIDGVLLTRLAEQFEQSHGLNDPAGGYGGLILEFFRYGPLDQYFLGMSEPPFFEDAPGRIYLLGCECGEVGCWPLSCLVDARDGTVSWHRFEHDHRPNRDYSSFGPFVFERRQYEEALRSLPK